MNELLGMLVPILMSGMGIGDLLRKLGGSGYGAASLDGLSAMTNSSAFNARMAFPMIQNQSNVRSAAEVIAQRLGMNPYSGAGQGFVSALGGAYNMAPGFFGPILGVPDGRQFFSTIANNASGISMASGAGRVDMFNPYSVMASQERTRSMSKVAYDLGVRPDGGYDISYSHGLNMNEMGKVTQRLMSSELAYRDGEYKFDATDAEKFGKNMKRLGSKVNEAVSMLSKVTGSVDEALNVMDRMAGGNFLGGTERQASEVASKAKKMAAAIRITSAMAGISPTETFAHMQGMMTNMVGGMGISDPALAAGTSHLMGNIAFNAMMGYNAWAAANPNASQFERQQGMVAVQGRARSYASESAAAMAAAIADNSDMFTAEEKRRMLSDLRSGNTEYAAGLARERLGGNTYTAYMTDPSLQIAARHRVSKNRNAQEFLNDIDQANIEGQLYQAETAGATRMLGFALADVDEKLSTISGEDSYGGERDSAVRKRFVELATQHGMKADVAEKTSLENLRGFLKHQMNNDDLSREENVAAADAALERIDSMVMDDGEKSAAMGRLRDIMGKSLTADKMKEIEEKIKNGASIESMVEANISDTEKAYEILHEITGGKITREYADQLSKPIEDIKNAQNPEYTAEERLDAISRKAKQADVFRPGGLKRELATEGFRNADNEKAKEMFEQAAGKDTRLSMTNVNFSDVYNNAANNILSDMFGDSLGNLKGNKLEEFNKKMAEHISGKVQGGASLKEAYADAVREVGGSFKAAMGEKGYKALEGLKDSDKLTRDAFYSAAAGVLDEKAGGVSSMTSKMRDLANGYIGSMTQTEAFKKFMSLAKDSGGTGLSEEEIEKIEREGLKSVNDNELGSARSAIRGVLGKLMPRGDRNDANADFLGMSQTADPNKAAQLMMALEWRRNGGDISDLKGQIDDSTVAMLQKLDDVNAQKMNAISDAIKTGGTKFRDQAIAGVSSRMNNLRKHLKDFKPEKIRDAFTGKDDETKQKIVDRLKEKGLGEDVGLLEALATEKIGNQDAIEVMKGGKKSMNKAKEDAGKKYGEQMLAIARKAGQSGSQAYEIGAGIGSLLEFFAKFQKGDALKVEVKGLSW